MPKGGKKKGQVDQRWVDTPPGCFCKALIAMIDDEAYAVGFRKGLLKSEVCRKFERLVPFHNQYWDHKRTNESIYGRAFTVNRSHHSERENVFENKYTKPYCALAGALLKYNKSWEKEELDKRLAEIAVGAPTPPVSARKTIKPKTRAEHVRIIGLLGGRCPCCGLREVVVNGVQVGGEFDHHHNNQYADLYHTWLICKPCHDDFTFRRVTRTQRDRQFSSYQDHVQRHQLLPGGGVTSGVNHPTL
jgi:hypothetical protein